MPCGAAACLRDSATVGCIEGRGGPEQPGFTPRRSAGQFSEVSHPRSAGIAPGSSTPCPPRESAGGGSWAKATARRDSETRTGRPADDGRDCGTWTAAARGRLGVRERIRSPRGSTVAESGERLNFENPPNKIAALTAALVRAMTAHSDAQAQRPIEIAGDLVASMTPEEVEQAKVAAQERLPSIDPAVLEILCLRQGEFLLSTP